MCKACVIDTGRIDDDNAVMGINFDDPEESYIPWMMSVIGADIDHPTATFAPMFMLKPANTWNGEWHWYPYEMHVTGRGTNDPELSAWEALLDFILSDLDEENPGPVHQVMPQVERKELTDDYPF
jgi:hypothetical protein